MTTSVPSSSTVTCISGTRLEAGDGFKLVDPDGLLAEAEYDLGILMREDSIELLVDSDPRERARWLAARTGLDVDAIWEWGVVERVSTGLLCTEIGLQPVDTRCSPSPRCSPRGKELHGSARWVSAAAKRRWRARQVRRAAWLRAEP